MFIYIAPLLTWLVILQKIVRVCMRKLHTNIWFYKFKLIKTSFKAGHQLKIVLIQLKVLLNSIVYNVKRLTFDRYYELQKYFLSNVSVGNKTTCCNGRAIIDLLPLFNYKSSAFWQIEIHAIENDKSLSVIGTVTSVCVLDSHRDSPHCFSAIISSKFRVHFN